MSVRDWFKRWAIKLLQYAISVEPSDRAGMLQLRVHSALGTVDVFPLDLHLIPDLMEEMDNTPAGKDMALEYQDHTDRKKPVKIELWIPSQLRAGLRAQLEDIRKSLGSSVPFGVKPPN